MERRDNLKEIIRMIVVLTVISFVMGLTLSLVESVTREPIEYSRLKFVKGPAILSILTDYDNDPIKEYKKNVALKAPDGGTIYKSLFPAKKNGKPFAVAFEVTGDGYHGKLGIMIGIELETEKLIGMRVMTHSETPGLGARAVEPQFYKQFSGISLKDVALKESGGKINAITGATITSQGVISAVRKGLELFHQNKDKIMNALKS